MVNVSRAGVEVLLEQRVVAFRGRLDELSPVLLDKLLHVVGDGDLTALAVLRGHEGLEVQQVDDAAEVLLRADGHVERERPWREGVAHRLHRAVEIRVLLVELVHDHDARLAASVALLPGDLGADGEVVVRSDHHDGALGRSQPAHGLTGEVEEAGRVEDVDLESVVLGEPDTEVDRDLASLLLGLGVHGGGVLVGGAHPLEAAGGKEHGLRDRGLAVVGVAEEDHVSDLVGRVISRHSHPRCKPAGGYDD